MLCKIFADDTTLYATTTNSVETLDNLIEDYVRKLGPLLEWCAMNRMDVTAKQKRKISFRFLLKLDPMRLLLPIILSY